MGALNREKKKREDLAHNTLVLSQARYIHEDIRLSYIGKLIMRIHCYPSFSPSLIWDIRKEGKGEYTTYMLYLNTLKNASQIAPGYNIVQCPSKKLEEIIRSIEQYSFSLEISGPSMFGLDGTRFGVSVYSNFMTQKHVQWWEDVDPEFESLSYFIQQQVAFFQTLENKPVTPEAT